MKKSTHNPVPTNTKTLNDSKHYTPLPPLPSSTLYPPPPIPTPPLTLPHNYSSYPITLPNLTQSNQLTNTYKFSITEDRNVSNKYIQSQGQAEPFE